MRRLSGALFALAVLTSPGANAADFALPDPKMTPGAANIPLEVFCRRPTRERRRLPKGLSCRVARSYNVPCDDIGVRRQLDHLVPLAIGGATIAANLWPQPMAEAEIKDRCDRGVQALVCHGGLDVQEARSGIAADWPTFCRSKGLIP